MGDGWRVVNDVKAKIRDAVGQELRQAYSETVKQVRYAKIDEIRKKALALFADNPEAQALVPDAFSAVEAAIVRNALLGTGQRVDGRDTKTIRPVLCQARAPPPAPGSALFPRGAA